jgi:hypothetical protein
MPNKKDTKSKKNDKKSEKNDKKPKKKDENLLVLNKKGQLVPKKEKSKPKRSKRILEKGKKFERKRGPHYANLIMHNILKELEHQHKEHKEEIEKEEKEEAKDRYKKKLKKKQEEYNKRLGKDHYLDKDAHEKLKKIFQHRIAIGDGMTDIEYVNRLNQILRQRIAMGDGDLDEGDGYYGMDRRSHRARALGSGRRKVAKRKVAKRKTGAGTKKGAKSNPYIMFLKKHKGQGWSRQKMLAEYRKSQGKKVKGKGVAVGGARKKRMTKKKGGVRVAGGARKNPWITFLKKHAGMGHTPAQLRKMYKAGH